MTLEKTIWLAGRKVSVKYDPKHDETFIFPTNAKGEFRKGKSWSNFMDRITALGFDICGGHYYSITVVGNLIDKMEKE